MKPALGSSVTWAASRSACARCNSGVRQVAIWRRPKLTPAVTRPRPGDCDHRGPADRVATPVSALRRGRDPPAPATGCAGPPGHRAAPTHGRRPGQEPAGESVRVIQLRTRAWVPGCPPLHGGLHRLTAHAHRGLPACPGDRGDLRQRQRPPSPRGHRRPIPDMPGDAPPVPLRQVAPHRYRVLPASGQARQRAAHGRSTPEAQPVSAAPARRLS